MNNQELELKIKEIVSLSNYFDVVVAAKQFEKEYKDSDFYKITKQPLNETIKGAYKFYKVGVNQIGTEIQNIINNLDIEHLTGLLNQLADTFGAENDEVRQMMNDFKTTLESNNNN